MGESFVDVSYRGLDLGRRLKLRDLRPEAGYLEIPLPMPVGTQIELVTDDGLKIAAHVTHVHEQVAGSDVHPGMRIKPHLGGAAVKWWQSRIDADGVAADEAAARAALELAAARAAAGEHEAKLEAEQRAKLEAEAAKLAAQPGNKQTMVMSTEAVQAALAAADAVEGEIDDVKATTVMDAIDISMITGEAPPDIGAATGDDDEAEISVEGDDGDGEVSGEMPATPSGRIVDGNGKKKGASRRSKKRPVKK